VKALANDHTEGGEAFQRRLGAPITEKSWSLARLAYEGAEQKKIGIEERAGRLARNIRSRLEDRLSEDPAVTARALVIYDPELPGPLTMALIANRVNGSDENASNPAAAELEQREQIPTASLEQQRIWLTEGLKRVEEELTRRESVSDSSLIWDSWVLGAQAKEATGDRDDGDT
jgi:hypothetical protein